MRITRTLLRTWDACYTDDEIASLVPEVGVTPLQVCDCESVPALDRIWVLLRPEVLGDALPSTLDTIVERAIRRILGRSGVPEWEVWAQAWLAGQRDPDAASAASAAASAAADAADAAAYAAAYAAADAAERAQQLADIRAALGASC